MKVKKGDEVVVLAGKDIGKRGTITHVYPDDDKVIVTSTALINVVKRHTKPRGATMQGGIIDKEMPIHVSNVALWCNKCVAPRRGKHEHIEGQPKRRVCVKCSTPFETA